MSDPSVSSSPHAWLCAYFSTLRRSPAFACLAADLQQKALADLVEADFPERAAEIRQWNATTRTAMLTVLDVMTTARPVRRETALWTAAKGSRRVQCVAVYMPTGVDVRVLEGGEPWQTVLIREPFTVDAQSRRWREELARRGWRVDDLAPGDRHEICESLVK